MTDQKRTAIIAGAGALPRVLAEKLAAQSRPYAVVQFEGLEPEWTKTHTPVISAQFEKLGGLFEALKLAGVEAVVFAGAMARPSLDVARADAVFVSISQELMRALKGGDDATLRFVVALFEGQGLDVIGAHEVLPELLPSAGVSSLVQPDESARRDAERAAFIARKLGEADVGQAVVVAGGRCLAVETLGGTDAMLAQVAALPAHLRGEGGVLYKASKPGQDRRVDMATIGPDTIAKAAVAGLSGIVVVQDQVIVLGQDEVRSAADAAGLFFWVHPA